MNQQATYGNMFYYYPLVCVKKQNPFGEPKSKISIGGELITHDPTIESDKLIKTLIGEMNLR